MKQPVVAVVGPTGVGKTKVSVEIAKRFNGEIISGDSMQIYKGMDIGTAKVTEEEKQGIPHYMLDIKDPSEPFSVAEFQQLVQGYIDKIAAKGKLPVIVGGTGLYIQSVLYNFQFSEQQRDQQFVTMLERQIEEEGIAPLYEKLKKVDPVQADKVHPNNKRRVIRALEVYEKTGLTMTEYQQQQKQESPYHPVLIGLNMDREELYNRINRRVDDMIQEGLVDEVNSLYSQGLESAQSMQAIGYKEFLPYINGAITLNEAIENLKLHSRRYAKRQLTYFRNKLDVNWYIISEENVYKKFEEILEELAGKLP
ncbi:tRNA (adenosine(37)-N6)-dimethylallyltransferase MiaA [Pontibacillus yanchengensis]|uniref:tRNA (Adenosine(37)-N6)-dimethylallyltransferase MiaA n=2 Tax=Pontibacillus yanchengensis TaxID=462910 RepID=A0ACC7VCK3_9BACI|nr:tRNA (adenosine(37)-N6)-dimethylallyltransferase MiaA [Pontibacillus yanchengensis]MYL33231.1 tRNA (adenosine(37)-N6)-dimethylallyltransferase MiaA [Pontibacillus yanchengensis]MYL51919.1 tRNA (adenosine(37)-N6)-dimethylallyltransferase MiaA [Pontibacillus yanchengensis]